MRPKNPFPPLFSFRGDHERARDYTRQALELGQRIKNPWIIAMGKFLEGTMHIQSGDIASARNSFGQAAGLFQAAKDAGFVHIAHSEEAHMPQLGRKRAGTPDLLKNHPFFLGNDWGRHGPPVGCFAFLDLEAGEFGRAAQLLGAAQAIRAPNPGFHRYVVEQREFEIAFERLSVEMGSEAFDRAFERGSHLAVEETIDLALGEEL